METLTTITDRKFNKTQEQLETLAKHVQTDESMIIALTDQFGVLQNSQQNNSRAIYELQCRLKVTPSFIAPQLLKHDLIEIQHQLAEDGRFSLTMPPEEVLNYYRTEVAECTFDEKYSTTIVMAPIQSKPWTIYSVHNLAFQLEPTKICTLMDLPTIVAVDNLGHEIYPFSVTDLLKCNPYDDDALCYIPQYPSYFYPYAKCLKKLFFTTDTSDIIKQCRYECRETLLPVIQMIKPQQYIVTNIKKLIVQCGHETKEHAVLKTGSFLVTLPCDCKAFEGDKLIINSVYPCPDTYSNVSLEHYMPALFFKQKSNELFSMKEKIHPSELDTLFVRNQDELVNLAKDIKNIELKQFKAPLLAEGYKFELKYDNTINDIIIFIWLCLITLYLLFWDYVKEKFFNKIKLAASAIKIAEGYEEAGKLRRSASMPAMTDRHKIKLFHHFDPQTPDQKRRKRQSYVEAQVHSNENDVEMYEMVQKQQEMSQKQKKPAFHGSTAI